ncbi:hypothetical protein LZ012_01525 [Dechloromonas sp. XY25]|uniref:Pyridoxamine 5'-phosphate oxidase putative domain-containing protein n=1 Tax=Dechloromonas hankyongensis TaxID=2908002 RepID=A0ABS9JXM5_9RHOO|nr:hypothetical protein [Dechloromonas hankyongensis]MCG2575668.1 hypothetical protein [Dechloromonas hankyongensis]
MELLDQEQRDFLCSGVSISLAACGDDRDNCVIRAVGCKFVDDGRRIAVFLRHSRSPDFFRFVQATGRIANVFCLPSTNRTIQIKGDDVRVEAFPAADLALIEGHLALFLKQVVPLGVPESVARTIFAYDPADLVMLSYVPNAVFTQTPGPKAGELLGRAA